MLKPILIFQITNGMIGCLKIFEEPLMLFGDYKGGVNSAAQTMNMKFLDTAFKAVQSGYGAVSYTQLDVYKRQGEGQRRTSGAPVSDQPALSL